MVRTRTWPARTMYILVAAALAMSLILTGAFTHQVSANPGLSEWTRVSTPSEEDWVLAPGSTIIDYAVADDGEGAYAIVYSDTEGYCMLKSTDSAAIWEDITDGLGELLDEYDYIDELMRVATDNVDPDFVAVALYFWDDSANSYDLHVFFSTDGGSTFEDAGEVEDGGVYLDIVADLAVSPESGGKRDIAIGGMANSTYGAGLFRCVVTGDSPGTWHDVTDFTDYVGWDNMWPSDMDTDDIYSWLVTDIIFSTSWSADKTILVTTIAYDYANGYQGVYLQCGSWGTSPSWNEKSTLGIEAVEIKTDNTDDIEIPVELVNYDARAIAGMTLPQDYNSRNTDTRMLWVWVNYYDPTTSEAMCEIMRVDDDSADPVGPMGQIEDSELFLTNISYHGTIAEGEAIAGVLGDGGYPFGGPVTDLFTTCCEGVQVYRNDGIVNMDICCMRWGKACKPPTGNMAMAVAYVGDDKAYAVALLGVLDYEEGAWSVTFDDGDIWNQLSLIDAYIDYVSDVAVSPDCNKTMLVSVKDEYGCGCDSVWLHAEDLPEADEYSGQWLRTWCGLLEGDNGGEFQERGLLRLAPEETTGDTVFLVDRQSGNVYWNDLETLACWDPIATTELDNIVDLVVQDADTLFALDYADEVAMFDDEWQEAVDGKVAYGWTIAVYGDHILVGGQDGDVSYSGDGGETFTELKDVAVAGLVTVAFDSYFDSNDTIYAALADAGGDNGVYRWIIGQSTDWKNLGAEDYDYTGLVLDRPVPGNPMTSADTGGVIYASYVSGNITGVARCLTPAQDGCCNSTNWDYLTVGLTSELFEMTPQALKICGFLTADNNKLFAIDGSEPYDMEQAEAGTVWSFEDCYAKATPDLTSPDDGATISAAPSECVNLAFTLEWECQCNAYVYDIQIALDEDFTGVAVGEEGYLPSATATPSYLVAEGDLSCDTYYWRVRSVEAETGQEIHSWWSEPRSFSVTAGGCFIATAAYGTPMAKEIQTFREYRDEYLLTNPLGQSLVDVYYSISPPMAEFIAEHPSLKPIVRTALVPVVAMSTIAVNTTPAEKAAIAGLLVLVSVAVAVWVTRRRGRGPQYT